MLGCTGDECEVLLCQEYDSKNSFSCYACHYSITKKKVMGNANCDEPFNERDIKTMPCDSYCAVSAHLVLNQTSTSYTI